MTFTIDLSTILAIASAIVALGGAFTVLNNAKKKLEEPFKEINDKLSRDNKRLNEIEGTLPILEGENTLILRTLHSILLHLMTNNNTGKMAEVEEELNNYLTEHNK